MQSHEQTSILHVGMAIVLPFLVLGGPLQEGVCPHQGRDGLHPELVYPRPGVVYHHLVLAFFLHCAPWTAVCRPSQGGLLTVGGAGEKVLRNGGRRGEG